MEGRLELRNASLFLRDVPNGVDQANGLILFDRNRATMQNLSGKAAAATSSLKAAASSASAAPPWSIVCRPRRATSAIAPKMASAYGGWRRSPWWARRRTAFCRASVSVTRAAFNPRTDVGALLASTTTPVAVALPMSICSGVQLDVRVVTAHTLEVETALTRNIQADADLRVRGTPDRPVLLGHVTVNSGQIEFFGNKYSINRGEINFNNPAKIEPDINMDLSTKVRGITVDISFSGSLNKLNFSYRSDPPLEASDIIALLAVGRTPSASGPLASPQAATNVNSSFWAGHRKQFAALPGHCAPTRDACRNFSASAISRSIRSSPTSPSFRRPASRWSSRSPPTSPSPTSQIWRYTNQQIVRVEWDFSRKWSAVALRDENGAFSIDFQYRKRFK